MGYLSVEVEVEVEVYGPSVIQRQIRSNSGFDISSAGGTAFPGARVPGEGCSGVVVADSGRAELPAKSSSENMAISDMVWVDGVWRVPGDALGVVLAWSAAGKDVPVDCLTGLNMSAKIPWLIPDDACPMV